MVKWNKKRIFSITSSSSHSSLLVENFTLCFLNISTPSTPSLLVLLTFLSFLTQLWDSSFSSFFFLFSIEYNLCCPVIWGIVVWLVNKRVTSLKETDSLFQNLSNSSSSLRCWWHWVPTFLYLCWDLISLDLADSCRCYQNYCASTCTSALGCLGNTVPLKSPRILDSHGFSTLFHTGPCRVWYGCLISGWAPHRLVFHTLVKSGSLSWFSSAAMRSFSDGAERCLIYVYSNKWVIGSHCNTVSI